MKYSGFELKRCFLPFLSGMLITISAAVFLTWAYYYHSSVFSFALLPWLNSYDIFYSLLCSDRHSAYYVLYTFFPRFLAAGFFCWFATRIFSFERRTNTSDFLFAKPIKKSKVFHTKLFVLFFYTLLLNLILFATSLLLSTYFKPVLIDFNLNILAHAGILLFALLFGSIGVWFGTVGEKLLAKTNWVLVFMFLVFAFSLNSKFIESPWSNYLAFFDYFAAASLITKSEPDLIPVIIVAALIIMCLTCSSLVYRRRDSQEL